jgi:hypothetical protein
MSIPFYLHAKLIDTQTLFNEYLKIEKERKLLMDKIILNLKKVCEGEKKFPLLIEVSDNQADIIEYSIKELQKCGYRAIFVESHYSRFSIIPELYIDKVD